MEATGQLTLITLIYEARVGFLCMNAPMVDIVEIQDNTSYSIMNSLEKLR